MMMIETFLAPFPMKSLISFWMDVSSLKGSDQFLFG